MHVLVLDDDDSVVSVLASCLQHCRVTACIDPHDALAVIEHDPVDALIVDFLMPAMPGDEVIRRARALRPDVPVVIVTGFAAAARTLGLQKVHILEKPFTRTELLKAVAAAQALKRTA
jgi:CheY-like chemotaxis protein